MKTDYRQYSSKGMVKVYQRFTDQLQESGPYAIYSAIAMIVGNAAASEVCQKEGIHSPLSLPGSTLRRSASGTSVRTVSERDSSEDDENDTRKRA